MKSINRAVSIAITILCFAALSAKANLITGKLWHVPEAISGNAVFANVPATTADVTFDVNSPFTFAGANVSVATWLANGSAFNIVENTAGTLASLMDNGVYGSMLYFSGLVTVTSGQTFTVTHDDGLQMKIGGLLVIDQPGPTPPITQTFTYSGPSGNLPFELVYAECCQGPAELQISLPLSNAPDGGSTLALLGGAMAMLGTVSRRLRK